MHRVLVDVCNEADIRELLNAICPSSMCLVFRGDSPMKSQDGESIESVISFGRSVSFASLQDFPEVRFVQMLSAGIDVVDRTYVASRGIRVADNNGLNSSAVADHALMLMLCLLRQTLGADLNARTGRWQAPPMNIERLSELEGKIVGILGMGRIGRKVARRLLGFGAVVWFADILDIDVSEFSGRVERKDFPTLLEKSDIVTLHVPLTEETSQIMNAASISRMKEGSLLINTSRGPVIEIADLVAALTNGPLGGAGLDVYPEEPKISSDLCALPNVVLTPHRAGSSRENWQSRIRFAFENLERFYSTGHPTCVVC